MMFYRRRASPKHRYNIIKVDYGGGGHHTRLRDPRDQLPCLWGAPLPPSLVAVGEKERGGEEKGKGGCTPCPIRTRGGGVHLLPFGLSPLFPYGPIRPIYSPSNSRNSPLLRKIPESLRTFPMSEYSRPIYRSLCLDHFETPRHAPISSETPNYLRYIKTQKLIISIVAEL